MKDKNITIIEESDIPKIEEKKGKRLVKKGVFVSIEGTDRDRLKVSFDKILNSSIPLNELKMVVAYLGAITETANFQLKK